LKNLTVTKRLFLEWARERFGEGVRFDKRGVVDFILPDGSRVIVKRPIHKYIYFTRRQWNGLRGDDLVAVVREDVGVLGLVKFKDIEATRRVVVGNHRFIVIVEDANRRVLRIRCSRETYERFKKVSAMFSDDEEALNYLLDSFEMCGVKPLRPRAF
jgi:CRISPR/Cas system CMR subunit Cmr4 (Cas7 group RAMP superfamily)